MKDNTLQGNDKLSRFIANYVYSDHKSLEVKAAQFGFTRSVLSAMMNEGYDFKYSQLQAIANVLQVSVCDLVLFMNSDLEKPINSSQSFVVSIPKEDASLLEPLEAVETNKKSVIYLSFSHEQLELFASIFWITCLKLKAKFGSNPFDHH